MRINKESFSKKIFYTVMTAITVFIIGVVINFNAIVSRAESAGKITATTCNIRADASTTSDAIGSKSKNDQIKILGQKTGADGYVWYQIYVNATTVGYVRSDLATITDGTTPGTVGTDGNVTQIDDTITAVNPVNGTVTGGQAVRVRADASTSSNIVASATSGTTLKVNGTKDGSDNRKWYYVEFVSDGNTVKGFIRSDFIDLAGELTPVKPETDTPDAGTTQPGDADTPASTPETTKPVTKDFDTQLEADGVWYLYDYTAGQKYSIPSMFEVIESNTNANAKKGGSSRAVKVWLVIFIILTIASLAAAAFFFLKLREKNDQTAFAEADKERRARRNAQKPTGAPTQRPVGAPAQRPAGAPAQRPAASTQRPGAPAQRPGAPAQRPAGAPTQRPAGAPTQRPAGTPAQRPAGAPAQRPAGAPTQRPAGAPTQRPAGVPTAPAQRPIGQPPVQRPMQGQASQSKPGFGSSQPAGKNIDDDDDFEFGFLNWDGEDKK